MERIINKLRSLNVENHASVIEVTISKGGDLDIVELWYNYLFNALFNYMIDWKTNQISENNLFSVHNSTEIIKSNLLIIYKN